MRQWFNLAVILCIGVSAMAEERLYRDQISGTAAPSSFDINGDGIKGHSVTFVGTSNLGQVHGGILVEYDFPAAAPNAACPSGTIKLPILVSAGTRALVGKEGQIFLRDDAASALFCLNPMTGSFTMSIKGNFVGGMGRFVGASGSYEYKGSGSVLLLDKNGMPFGGFVLETEGKLNLPNG